MVNIAKTIDPDITVMDSYTRTTIMHALILLRKPYPDAKDKAIEILDQLLVDESRIDHYGRGVD